MQVSEGKAVCFTAVDGGLADLYIEMSGFQGSGDDEATDRLATAIERIIHAAAVPPIQVRHKPAEPGQPDDGLPCLRAPQRFRTSLPDITVSRIRSFDPIIKSGLRSLDIAVVTATAASFHSDAVTCVDSASSAGSPLDRGQKLQGLLDAACQYALKFGRGRVCLVTGPAADAEPAFEPLSGGYPSIELTTMTARQALSGLLSGDTDLDVVVAEPLAAELLTEAALKLGGAPELATETRFAGGIISVTPAALDFDFAAEASASVDIEVPERSSALLLAAADLMMWLDQDIAAGRIVHSFCRNLERGCHTPELWLINPYTRMLDTAEFEEAIISSLGERSEKFEPKACGALPGDLAPRSRATLRLVHSA